MAFAFFDAEADVDAALADPDATVEADAAVADAAKPFSFFDDPVKDAVEPVADATVADAVKTKAPIYTVKLDQQAIIAAPEAFNVSGDPEELGFSGLDLDDATLVVKGIKPNSFMYFWQAAAKDEPVEAGDLLTEVNGRNVKADGLENVLALVGALVQEVPVLEMTFTRAKKRRKLEAAMRTAEDFLLDEISVDHRNDLVVLDEGEMLDGVSEERYNGNISVLNDGRGYAIIEPAREVKTLTGFDSIPVPCYLVDNGEYFIDDLVAFNLAFTGEGRPRAQRLVKVRQNATFVKKPQIKLQQPLIDEVSWVSELKRGDTAFHRPLQQKPNAMLTGARPAVANIQSIEAAAPEELANLQVGYDELEDSKVQREEVLSDVDSDVSNESLSGEISRRWETSRRDKRYLYSRDKAIDFSESWRATAWTEEQWEAQLRASGELASGARKSTKDGTLASYTAGGSVASRYKGQEKQASRQEAMVKIGKELEAEKKEKSGNRPEGNQPQLEPDPGAAGFSRQTQQARDAQTDKVGSRMFKEFAPNYVGGVLKEGILAEPVFRPPAFPELQISDLLEAKTLLHDLMGSIEQGQDRLQKYDAFNGQQQGGAQRRGPGKLGVDFRGAMYAASPKATRESIAPHLFETTRPDADTAQRPQRKWL